MRVLGGPDRRGPPQLRHGGGGVTRNRSCGPVTRDSDVTRGRDPKSLKTGWSTMKRTDSILLSTLLPDCPLDSAACASTRQTRGAGDAVVRQGMAARDPPARTRAGVGADRRAGVGADRRAGVGADRRAGVGQASARGLRRRVRAARGACGKLAYEAWPAEARRGACLRRAG